MLARKLNAAEVEEANPLLSPMYGSRSLREPVPRYELPRHEMTPQAAYRVIMDELVPGILRRESIVFFEEVILDLKAAGCDAVVLGCTEIPLIMNDDNSALPTLDSTRLLARAALKAAGAPRDDGRSPR